MTKQKLPAVLAGLALAMPLAASANLILNGGFENPAPASPYSYRTGNDITGWNISSTHNGVVQFDSTYQPVGVPNYSVQIESGVGQAGNPTPDSISQMVVTVPGATYTVSFLLAAWNASATSMNVTIDSFLGNYTSVSQSYASYSFSFIADDSSATLKFENAGAWGVSYPQIDNVSMVPEPTTVIAGALLLLPFGASTLRMLRRNRATV